MQIQKRFSLGLVLLIVIVGFGCAADPAADKPAAEIAEAQPEVAPATDGIALPFTPESSISWVGSKVTGRHDGGFHRFDGQVTLVDDDPTASSVNITIDIDSLWADDEKLAGHLKSADFFDAAAHPSATFNSTSIETAEEGYMITGNLTLHGVTKSIRFPASIAIANGTVTVEASFAIKRYDFEIEYPGRKDDLIRDDVAITLDLVAAAASADPEAAGDESH